MTRCGATMWTNQEKKEFARAYVLTCKFYNQQVDADIVQMVIDDLWDLDFKSCLISLQAYRKNSKNKFWPKAADIRDFVEPEIDSKTLAISLAHKIDQAVAKHGGYWEQGFISSTGERYWEGNGSYYPDFKSAVVAVLGDIGWHYVCQRGGWLNIRNSANEMDEGMFIAQTRDLLQSTINLKKQGVDLLSVDMRGQVKEISFSNDLLAVIGYKK